MKILINSYPRSGTTTLVDAIRSSVLSDSLHFGEDFFHNPQWISKSHLPVIFYGSFPSDIVIGTVLRDPVDAISSNCFRWANGHTGNIVQGRIVIDKGRESQENKFDDMLKNLIIHQIKQYVSYYSCLMNTSENVLMIEYSEIKNNLNSVIDKIIIAAGGNTENLNYSAAAKIVENPPQPTKEKTELYYKIREFILSVQETNECYSLYHKLLEIKGDKNV